MRSKFQALKLVSTSLLVALSLCCSISSGQVSFRNSAIIKTRVLNANSGFEDGLTGWTEQKSTNEVGVIDAVNVVTRDWTPLGFPYEDFADLGSKLTLFRLQQLSGTRSSQLGQIFSIGSSNKHVLNVHAYRDRMAGRQRDPFAAARVSYYDSSWKLLDTVEVPIGGRALKFRGDGDGLNFYSLGIDVPTGARFAHLYMYITDNTYVYVDAFGLFEFNQASSLSVAKNLITNPRMDTYFNPTIDLKGAQGFGVEFWGVETEWTRGLSPVLNIPSFGSPNMPESAFQTVPLAPNRTYTLRFEGGFPSVTAAAVGVDFFDQNWKRIGGRNLVSIADQFSYLLRIETPANMVYAQAFYWCDTVKSPFPETLYGHLTLQQQATTINTATSTILSDSLPYLRPKFGDRLGSSFKVIYSDADGIDMASLNARNVVFRSRTDPAKTYQASIDPSMTQVSSDGKVALVRYDVLTGYEDVGAMVIRGKQVKDKLGNFAASKTFQVDVP